VCKPDVTAAEGDADLPGMEMSRDDEVERSGRNSQNDAWKVAQQ
jgi:hypothetical protein